MIVNMVVGQFFSESVKMPSSSTGRGLYINRATASLVSALRGYVDQRFDLKGDPNVEEALENYFISLREPHAIVPYLQKKIDGDYPSLLNSNQIAVLFITLHERAKAAWMLIPEFARLLRQSKYNDLAPPVEKNASEELSDSWEKSHVSVMIKSFMGLVEKLGLRFPVRAGESVSIGAILGFDRDISYLKALWHLKYKQNDPWVKQALCQENPAQWLMDHYGGELGISSLTFLESYCGYLPHELRAYSSLLVREVRERDSLLTYALEFTRREAGSVDDSDSVSQIGIYGRLVDAYKMRVLSKEGGDLVKNFDCARTYAAVHGDSPSPGDSLEHRHAEDALQMLMGLLDRLQPSPQEFTRLIQTDRMFVERQQKFWIVAISVLEGFAASFNSMGLDHFAHAPQQ